MFSPQDALPLPPRPNPEQYKKRAKDLAKAANSGDSALHAWTTAWIGTLVQLAGLTITPQLPVRVDLWIAQFEQFVQSRQSSAKFSLANAHFVIARAHGFDSWPKFAKHIVDQSRANTPISDFEQAADAIVAGDLPTLESLLRKSPDLVRARSTREHRATLLHYVSANGVEGYRQKTPNNILEIAALLLKKGAEVDATADVYGGGSTTLMLTATSVHPERAGVQEALLDLLLQQGASLDKPDERGVGIVNACLANGRARAAEFLATRGALLDLEAAAGLGRLNEVQKFFNAKGNLLALATPLQMERGFLRACEYGHTAVVEFLLERGVNIHSDAGTGMTALHYAVLGAHVDTITLLLAHGANLETRNRYGGTALGQARWSAENIKEQDFAPTIEALLKAGAK